MHEIPRLQWPAGKPFILLHTYLTYPPTLHTLLWWPDTSTWLHLPRLASSPSLLPALPASKSDFRIEIGTYVVIHA